MRPDVSPELIAIIAVGVSVLALAWSTEHTVDCRREGNGAIERTARRTRVGRATSAFI